MTQAHPVLQTWPPRVMTLDEAMRMQFRLVDLIQKHFEGARPADLFAPDSSALLQDLCAMTKRVECILAELFDAEAAVLVPREGTGANQEAAISNLKPGSTVLVHAAPVYPTTATIFRAMGLVQRAVDFNDPVATSQAITPDLGGVWIQGSRQWIIDRYDVRALISAIKAAAPNAVIITDDNFIVMRCPQIACQMGSDLSTFSIKKLGGPLGVGCIVGREARIGAIRKDGHSAGTHIRNPQALEALRALIYAPVASAMQSATEDEIVRRLRAGEVPGVADAHISHSPRRHAMAVLTRPIAKRVLEVLWPANTSQYLSAVLPEFHFEVPTLIRMQSVAGKQDPTLTDWCLRLIPGHAGADTVIRLLDRALSQIPS